MSFNFNRHFCKGFMRIISHLILLSVLIAFSASADESKMPEEIPEKFESISVTEPEAYDFAKDCNGISEAQFKQVAEETQADTVATAQGGFEEAYLIFARKHVYCIRMTENLNPILPIEAFKNTVGFTGMIEDENALWIDVSRQISTIGKANFLAIDGTGAGYQINFTIASKHPVKVDFDIKFLKKGKFKVDSSKPSYHFVGNLHTGRMRWSDDELKSIFNQ